MRLSDHAVRRMQQRGIPRLVVNWIAEFGSTDYHDGLEVCRLDRKAMKRLRQYGGKQAAAMAEKYASVYVVVADETVVTAAHQKRRLHRH